MKPWTSPAFYVVLLAALGEGLMRYPRILPHDSIPRDLVEVGLGLAVLVNAMLGSMWGKKTAPLPLPEVGK